jgi:hypothetical protein
MAKFGKKITELSEITSLEDNDFIEVSELVGLSEYESKKITFENLAIQLSGNIGGGGTGSINIQEMWAYI